MLNRWHIKKKRYAYLVVCKPEKFSKRDARLGIVVLTHHGVGCYLVSVSRVFSGPSNCGMSVQFHALSVVYRPLMGTIRGFFEGHETNRGTYSRAAESRGAQCRLVCPQVVLQPSQCVQDIPQGVYRYRVAYAYLAHIGLWLFSIFFWPPERGIILYFVYSCVDELELAIHRNRFLLYLFLWKFWWVKSHIFVMRVFLHRYHQFIEPGK